MNYFLLGFICFGVGCMAAWVLANVATMHKQKNIDSQVNELLRRANRHVATRERLNRIGVKNGH